MTQFNVFQPEALRRYRLISAALSGLMACFALSVGCGEDVAPEAGQPSEGEPLPISVGPEIPSEDSCGQEYSVCTYLRVPSDLEGQPRSIALALYRSIPPSASPDILITQVNEPSLKAGERYPLRAYPFLDTGEYYVWVNLYMEGGGSARPVNGVDYTGFLAEPINFDGRAIELPELSLEPASGW